MQKYTATDTLKAHPSNLTAIYVHFLPAREWTPAKDIGVFDSIGSLEAGKCADFLVLNKDLKLMATFIDGKLANGTTDFASVK